MLRKILILFVTFLFLCLNKSTYSQDRHYWDQAIGGKAALLGGLVVGGVRDYSAAFYNPGALGFLSKNNLNFSFSAYGVKDFRFKNGSGLDPDPSYTRVTLFPSSLAGGLPFLSDSLNRFGYFIFGNSYSVVRSSARFEDYMDVVPSRPYAKLPGTEVFEGEEFLINQGKFNALLQEVTVGFGWGRKISDKISIGATLLGAYRDQTKLRNEFYYALDTLNNKMASSNIFVDIDYYAIRIFGKVGIAAEWDDLKLGATITLPSIHLLSGATDGASITATNFIAAVDTVSGNVFEIDLLGSDRQEDLSSKYRSTLSMAFGLEYILTEGTKISFTAEWFSKMKPYVAIQPKSDNFFRNLPFEISVFNSEHYLRVYDSFKGLINFGLGFEHKLNDRFKGYAAFRTDFSNAAFDEIDRFYFGFTDFDIYHFTIGGSAIVDRSFFALGVEYSLGINSGFQQIFDFPRGAPSVEEFFSKRYNLNSKAVYNSINVFFGVTHMLGE